MEITKYTMAGILLARGIKATQRPLEEALGGAHVILLSSSRVSAALCQRGYYERLLKSKTPVCNVRAGKMTFVSKGTMIFISPDANLEKYQAMDRDSTFFCITPE